MDLVCGAGRVIVAMQHTARGEPKIVTELTLPLTALRPVDMVVTELAVIAFREGCATLLERAPGTSVPQIIEATGARLTVSGEIPEMLL